MKICKAFVLETHDFLRARLKFLMFTRRLTWIIPSERARSFPVVYEDSNFNSNSFVTVWLFEATFEDTSE